MMSGLNSCTICLHRSIDAVVGKDSNSFGCCIGIVKWVVPSISALEHGWPAIDEAMPRVICPSSLKASASEDIQPPLTEAPAPRCRDNSGMGMFVNHKTLIEYLRKSDC